MGCVSDGITRKIQEIDRIGFDKGFTFNGPFSSNKSECDGKVTCRWFCDPYFGKLAKHQKIIVHSHFPLVVVIRWKFTSSISQSNCLVTSSVLWSLSPLLFILLCSSPVCFAFRSWATSLSRSHLHDVKRPQITKPGKAACNNNYLSQLHNDALIINNSPWDLLEAKMN